MSSTPHCKGEIFIKKDPVEAAFEKSKIKILKVFNAADSPDFDGGFLIWNPKGSGKLRSVGGMGADHHSYEIVVYNDIPLVKSRSKKIFFENETEREVATGMGLSDVYGKKRPFAEGLAEGDLTRMLYRSADFINSLYQSLYFVTARDFYPARSDGSYFHSVGTEYVTEPSSLGLYADSPDLSARLSYMIPTEPENPDKTLLAKKMISVGAGTEGLGVVLSLGNGINLLIDGHARAAACAMLGKKLKCLTIIPALRYFKKEYNKYSAEYASLSITVPRLPENLDTGGFVRASDNDKPTKYIEKLIRMKNDAFDKKPFGELDSIVFPGCTD